MTLDTASRLQRMRGGSGAAVVIETGTRFTLDPWTKHGPTLLDAYDASADHRLDYLERAVDIAVTTHATCVSFFSGVLVDTPAAEGWARLRGRLPRLLEHAAARGVHLSLEPEPGMLVETVGDALALHADLGGPPGLGVTVDVGHCLVVEPGGLTGALRDAAPLLSNVQLDDMPRSHHEHRPFGEGDLDLRSTLAALADVGYTGVAAVELPRHSHDAPALARRSLTALRTAWAEVAGITPTEEVCT